MINREFDIRPGKGDKTVFSIGLEPFGRSGRREDVNEKITLAKVRKALYKGAKALGDVQAVRKKRVGKRIVRRAAGKVAGRALGKLFR